MIVTGEASGDMHGARLVNAMQEMQPQLSFCGMGGVELKNAGVTMLFDAAKIAVVGLTEVISHFSDILVARRTLIDAMKKERPALLILIDYPDFNLLLAAKAKKLGIPVFYYISPQVWAWRAGRVKKIGRLTDQVGVILPFEKEFYKQRGVDVEYVGHPLTDTVTATKSKNTFLQEHNIAPEKTVIGLLPGSRKKEISSLLPDFLEAARLLAEKIENISFLLPRAATVSPELLEKNGLERFREKIDIQVVDADRYNLMAACDAVVCASGTVTLELAILGTPTVTCYRVSPRTYRIGRLLVKLEFFSLVNLIAGRKIIPELLQDEVQPAIIAEHLQRMVRDNSYRQTLCEGLKEVRTKLGEPGASKRAARLALKTAGLQ